jgi:hypothetical protein
MTSGNSLIIKLLLWLFAVAFVLACALPANAETLMSLPWLPGHQVFTIDESAHYKNSDLNTYKGRCGSAKILVKNVDYYQFPQNGESMSFGGMGRSIDEDVEFVIYNPAIPGRVLKPDADDSNGIACVQTKQGKRILIWGMCDGTACADEFDQFYVIDPEKLIYIAPKDPNKNSCGYMCARRLIGKTFVDHIEGVPDKTGRWPKSR